MSEDNVHGTMTQEEVHELAESSMAAVHAMADKMGQPTNGKPLGRDAILNAVDITTERVDVPEWSGYLYVRQLNAGERDQIEASLLDKNGQTDPARLKDFRARMAAMAIVDENGVRLFHERDMHKLSQKSAVAMDRVLDVARRLSGMDPEAEKVIAGNSEAGPDAG